MMNFKLLVRLPLLVAFSVMAGCGYLFGDDGMFRDKSQDYKQSPELEVIEVPPEKSTDALQDIYPIPDIEHHLFGAVLAQ